MATKKQYTVYDNGEPIGEYSSLEAAALLNLPCATITSYASSGAKALGRYTFEVSGAITDDPLAIEWDRVRKEILKAGGMLHEESHEPGRAADRIPQFC